MARRVYLAPGVVRVSHPGHDAATAALQNLIFSSDLASLGGSATGELVFEESPVVQPGNQRGPVTRTIALPPGTGIPVVWVWDVRPDLKDTGYGYGLILIFYETAGSNIVFESRSAFTSHIGYMIYRNRSQ